MPLSDADLNSLVVSPSLSGVIYQAHTLINELERINDEEFPHEACLIRDVFLCIVEHILEELRGLQNPIRPFDLGIEGAARTRALASYVRDIYSKIRYLTASSPRQSPPSIHDEIVRLTNRHFPKQHGDPVCVVRPQWTYNLKCVPLSHELKKMSNFTLDPANRLKVEPEQSIISVLWKNWLRNRNKDIVEAPRQIGILSFASIDTADALFIPLLGHELGHFIAFSPPTPYHEDSELLESANIREDDVKDVMSDVTRKPFNENEATRYHSLLRTRVEICLRELLADRLAARMLGLSFFVAQAKFIKSSLSWNQPLLLLETGYPSMKLRLSQILSQIMADGYPGNPVAFLKECLQTNPGIAKPLITYLQKWQQHLDELPATVPTKSGLFADELLVEPFYKLIEGALNQKTLGILSGIAQRVIPDINCPTLTVNFFERIARLEQDLPPSVSDEGVDSFTEIMSAAWAYQIVYGESRENEMSTIEKRLDEHSKTCRLVFKAIELIPAQREISDRKSIEAKSQTSFNPVRQKSGLLRVFNALPRKVLLRLAQEQEYSKKGVLSSNEIHRRAVLPITDASHINISPLRLESIKGASLDVHLGNWFAYARRTKLSGIKIGDENQEKLLKSIGQAQAFIPFDKTFLLHPGDLALGVTQEFIALPKDVMAFVEGRSSLGRLGLFVATATTVAPTFHGVIVLELANAGTVPLELRPGIGIAQLVFQVMTDSVSDQQLYRSKYYCQIRPIT